MVVEFAGRQVDITPAVRARAQGRIDKLARLLPGITHVRVILSAEKRGLSAEVTVRSPLADLAARGRAAKAGPALAMVFDTLTEQAKRNKGKRRESPRRIPVRIPTAAAGASVPGVINAAAPARGTASSRAAAASRAASAEEGPADGPRVIRERRRAPRTLTAAAAAAQAQRLEEGVVIYLDASTGKLSVMYRRRDGNVGVVEPES